MYRLIKKNTIKCVECVTSTYKKANGNIKKIINEKGKKIIKKSFDNIIDRMDVNIESNCFITWKNNQNNP